MQTLWYEKRKNNFDKCKIIEAKEEPYKLVMFHNSHENLRDVGKEDAPDYLLITKAAKKHGIEIFHVEYSGSYVTEEGNPPYWYASIAVFIFMLYGVYLIISSIIRAFYKFVTFLFRKTNK